jgi:hypothetical protein
MADAHAHANSVYHGGFFRAASLKNARFSLSHICKNSAHFAYNPALEQ